MDNSGIISPEPHLTHLADSHIFTDFSPIAETSHSRIVRARRHNQWWVLKSMKGDYAQQPFFLQMLQKEYDILTRLHHSGIDRPISIECVEGYGPCLVMECIEGVTLDQFHTDRDRRRRVAHQIVETMAYVHSCQIVHRDLKPANIMVTQNGENVKVIDFGLADADNYAILKQPAGTPRYIAPEQLTAVAPDVRSDVYSLGVILGELRLGWPYRHIIRRCTGPIERRYMGARPLLRAMRRVQRLPAIVALAASITLLTLLISTLSILLPRPSVGDGQTAAPPSPAHSSAKPISSTKPKQAASPEATLPQASHTAAVPQQKPPIPPLLAGAPLPIGEGGGRGLRGAPYETATRRVDKYMADHHYARLLSTLQTEPAPSLPSTRDPRCKELERQEAELLQGLWAEVEQIRQDARSQMTEQEAEVLYTAVVNYAMTHYSQTIGKALREYLNRKPSLGS